MFSTSVLVVIFCVFFYVIFDLITEVPLVPAGEPSIVLGTQGYDIGSLKAPSADSLKLDILSYILTKTPFGPAICRILLNQNKVFNLRELGDQIKLPPLEFPMRRLNKAERSAYDKIAQQSDVSMDQLLQEGLGVDTKSKRRSIMDYAESYQKCDRSNKDANSCLVTSVMQRTIDQVQQWETDFKMNIFSSINVEDVMTQARESDERFRAGKPISILDGVPVAIKDDIDVKGHKIYHGKSKHASYQTFNVSEVDDEIVKRLRELGAIIFGVTIMVEGGVSPLGYNIHWKGPFNPYDTNRYSGGSSSGSTVSVSTGLIPVAIGFDGGGSIRVPASMSGIHGLATTFGRIPFDKQHSSTMIKAGPMVRTSLDAAIIYAALARTDKPGHFYSQLYDGEGGAGLPAATVAGYQDVEDLSDVRIGYYQEWFEDSKSSIVQPCSAALQGLVDRGAQLVPIQIPHLQWIILAHSSKIASEFGSSFDKLYKAYATATSTEAMAVHDLEPSTRITLSLGKTFSGVETNAANKIRAWAFNYVTKDLFQDLRLTAIAAPTIPMEVPYLSERAKLRGSSDSTLVVQVMKFISLANLIGLPAYTVPVGFVKNEKVADKSSGVLPVGFQLMGEHWQEHKLLRLAHAVELDVENKREDVETKPAFYFDALQG